MDINELLKREQVSLIMADRATDPAVKRAHEGLAQLCRSQRHNMREITMRQAVAD